MAEDAKRAFFFYNTSEGEQRTVGAGGVIWEGVMMQMRSAWEAPPRTASDAQQGGLGRLDCKQQPLETKLALYPQRRDVEDVLVRLAAVCRMRRVTFPLLFRCSASIGRRRSGSTLVRA